MVYDDLAVVVENKPRHRDIWEGQLDVNVPAGVEHDPRVATVVWESVVLAWGRLLEAGHLGTAEAVLLGDFLTYVEEHFPRLRPYSRVALCGTDEWRISRRCRAVLEAIAGAERVQRYPGWGDFMLLDEGQTAQQVGFFPRRQEDGLGPVVEIDPADTGSQAKKMYAEVSWESLAGLLADERWLGFSNFHIGHVASGLFHQAATMPLEAYFRLWASNPGAIRTWGRDEFEAAFEFLLHHGVLEERHREGWNSVTTNTARKKIGFRPGITLRWRMPLDEASMLDSRGRLEAEVRGAMEAAAKVLRLRLSS
ncbi:MAG: hypothetical protein HY744_15975 [Deltaproteobacteria bacterium]|nr:hypothetical protein [Deltaproteobacteria bacterium]